MFDLDSVRRRRLFVVLPLATVLLALITGVVIGALVDRPEVEGLGSYQPSLRTEILDREGELVRTYATENRILIPDNGLPAVLRNAITAAEDGDFDSHGPVDLSGAARAAYKNLRAGEIEEGASTITMQLARQLFLTRDRVWTRKFEEIVLAIELEKKYSKDQIVTLYANLVNAGHGNYGMEAAARDYFEKTVADLTLTEAATLAGIINQPSYYLPRVRPEAVKQRRNYVLRRMLEEGHISGDEYERAIDEPVVVARRRQEGIGPYFTEEVRRDLAARFGTQMLYQRGLVVRTTLDPAVQRAAEQAVDEGLAALERPDLEVAAVVLESATGAVRALVGGRDFGRSEFDRVTQARRQVGSAFKPFVYGAALEHGFTAADTIFDAPVVFAGADGRASYSPRNDQRRYFGITTLRRALQSSLNVTSVKLLDLIGVERVIDFARRCGIAGDLPPYPTLALGAASLAPLEVAAAYATFGNRGIYVAPYLIEEVRLHDGQLLEQHRARSRQAMDPRQAYVLTRMLQGVATALLERASGATGATARGTRSLAELDLDVAGKTGTTDTYTDAWFVGFTPRYTVLTWVGYDEPRSMGRGMTGSAAALPIWSRILRRGLDDGWLAAGESFERPGGIVERRIEPSSGLLASELARTTATEVFVEGTEPEQVLDERRARILELPWYLQQPFYLPKEGERMPDPNAGGEGTWKRVQEAWSSKDRRRHRPGSVRNP